MSKSKKPKIDLNKIVKNNPDIDPGDLAQNLKIIQELRKSGVNVGPNYNLGSPFSKPGPDSKQTKPMGSALKPA
jgi:hypothetical protein